MIWSANLLLLATLAGAIPSAVADRVRAAVGAQWQVDPVRVSLEWGRIAEHEQIADSAAFRLLGTGRDGRFVIAVRTARGEVAISVRAGVRDSTWTTARAVGLGDRLDADDLVRSETTVWGKPVASGEPPIGWEVRRALAKGEAAAPPAIVEPAIIEPGQTVSFVWERAGFRIVREAIAQTRARRGERVVARVEARQERLVGIAVEPGVARMEGKGIR